MCAITVATPMRKDMAIPQWPPEHVEVSLHDTLTSATEKETEVMHTM